MSSVVHDDLDLPFGTIRLKADGGHGGHKGLLSTIEQLGSQDFLRIRMGIGRPAVKRYDRRLRSQPFSRRRMKHLPEIIATAGDAVSDILSSGIQAAMNKYNGRTINNFSEEV